MKAETHFFGTNHVSVTYSLTMWPHGRPSSPQVPDLFSEIPSSLLDKSLRSVHFLPDTDLVLLGFVDSRPPDRKSIL